MLGLGASGVGAAVCGASSGRRRRLSAVLAGVACALAFAIVVPVAGAVTISPLPGTPDAMPSTQISILGTPVSNVASVTVTGSESGTHEGQLEPYSAGAGASYVLSSPLSEGEQVKVVVSLKEGAPQEDAFSVARLAMPEELLKAEGEKPEEQEHFKSEPTLRPPKLKVNKADPNLEGDFFLDPLPAPSIHVGKKLLEFEPVGPNGLMILNPEGKLVWWHQFPQGEVGTNLESVTYEGQPAIAWWQGAVSEAAYGLGEGVIANTSYEPIAHVPAGNGLKADIHELAITPQGQAWIDAYELECNPICSEATPPVLDSVAQEIDIRTGLVMWEWHAMTQIPTSETEVEPANGVWDPYHLNSIEPLPDGRVLISLRDTSGVYLIDQDTGALVWQIAGKSSSFTIGKGARFHFQHDARLQGKLLNTLTVFGNEAGPPVYAPSRGLVLRLSNGKVQLAHQYPRPDTTVAPAEGSMQVMRHGEAVVGFGATQFFSEFSRGGAGEKKGTLLFDAELAKGDGTYRVLRFPWQATPNTLPKLAVESGAPGEVNLYASWNGATQVARWEVLAGESEATLAPAGTFAWGGFETEMSLTTGDTVFEVRALDAKGHVLATSEAVGSS